MTPPPPARDSPGSIFIRFLRFGALAWGGPAAQIAMIKRECVDEERWTSEESFRKTLAVYQVLPGPEAHELCVYLGRLRGGKVGGFLAGLGFMLPGFVLMLGLSAAYVDANLAGHLEELFYGLSATVAGLVARALIRLGGSFVTDVPSGEHGWGTSLAHELAVRRRPGPVGDPPRASDHLLEVRSVTSREGWGAPSR